MEQKLKYKTRGNSSPQGKQKVYFCCHPDDFDGLFQKITEEILGLYNCAIFYYPATTEASEEERLFYLRQMQLVVIPITSGLLMSETQALRDLQLAREAHVAILPLMQEPGLERKFNRICGNLQFLDEHDNDPTAIPYREKLENFLSAVLIGDELAKKVRAAFDAYIFISYRKKDRHYAQELMRLIHNQDFCRDIAMWYDEYLTPGENFDEAIQEALRKCDLFTMVVTPNLVNEENYVMKAEYPMAKKEQKQILLAQMVPTDQEALRRCYEGIGVVTDAHDEEALRKLFIDSVKKCAIRENNDSPEHNFFIGLAYLKGIDMEVNQERGVQLITESAEQGVLEAMQKLVTMYHVGEGIERNETLSLEWQEKVVACCEKKYQADKIEKNAKEYMRELIYLGNAYHDKPDIERSIDVFQKYLQLCIDIDFDNPSLDSKQDLAKAYSKLGRIIMEEGHSKEAGTYIINAIQLLAKVYEKKPDISTALDLMRNYRIRGELALKRNLYAEGQEYYEKSVALGTDIVEKTAHTGIKSELSYSVQRLGDLAKYRRDYESAKEFYLKALEMQKALYEEMQTDYFKADIATTYSSLGDVEMWQKHYEAAESYYQSGLSFAEEVVKHGMDGIPYRKRVFIAYRNLGKVAFAKGNYENAKQYYEKSLVLVQQLEKETHQVSEKQGVSLNYASIGKICIRTMEWAAAKEYYLKALDIDQQLVLMSDTTEYQQDLSATYNNLGYIAMKQEKWQEAMDYYLQDLEISKKIEEKTGTYRSKQDLLNSNKSVEYVAWKLGNTALQKECHDKVVQLKAELGIES